MEETSQDIIIHMDGLSIGIYPMPVSLLEKFPVVSYKASIRTGILKGEKLIYHDDLQYSERPIFITSGPKIPDQGINSWLRISPNLSWSWLWSAIPYFWQNRYRITLIRLR